MTKKIVAQPGDVHGSWTLIEPIKHGKHTYWLCQCFCGIRKEVRADGIFNGKSTSCGCQRKTSLLAKEGDRYGRLVLVKQVENQGSKVRWTCLCDCGSVRQANLTNLKSGRVSSCGCYSTDRLRERKTTHGHTRDRHRTREYEAWCGLRMRCSNPRDSHYHLYGGRGIKVCTRWADSFEAFLEDMGPVPDVEHSVDRIDPDGDYEPSNCRWATYTEQNRNRRVVHVVEVDGKIYRGLYAAASALGVSRRGLELRIKEGYTSIRGRAFIHHGRVGDADPETLKRAA